MFTDQRFEFNWLQNSCALLMTVPLRRSILILAGGIEDTRVSHSSSAQVRMVTEVTFHGKWIIQINAARRSITHFYQLYTYFNSIGGFSINIFSHWHSFVFAHQPFWVSMLSGTILHVRSEDGGGFYFAWQDLGECWTIHSSPAFLSFLSLSLFFSLAKVEIWSRTLIPLFRPGSVHSGPASWHKRR